MKRIGNDAVKLNISRADVSQCIALYISNNNKRECTILIVSIHLNSFHLLEIKVYKHTDVACTISDQRISCNKD
jgi:hypothetical protein